MKKLLISPEAESKMLQIAGNEGLREVARVIAYLEDFQAKMAIGPTFWNIRDSASGALESSATMKCGTPIWRLCPTHVHCIPLLVVQDGDLLVLDICNRADIVAIEDRLINS